MHRSGTSALARVINLLGADLGKNLLPANEGNQKGYWEHEEVLGIHERLLKELGYVWDDIRPLPPDWWLGEAAIKAHSELLNTLTKDFGSTPLWAVKEPRMCRLLKLWLPIFAELKVRPHFIIIFRNPLEVAASLAKRDGVLGAKSFLLWLIHVLESERDTREYMRAFVSMEQLMGDWQATMKNLSQILKIQWPNDYDEIDQEVKQFLDPGLKHHNIPSSLLETDANVPAPLVEICSLLKETALETQPCVKETFSTVAENLCQEMERFVASAFMEDVYGHLKNRRDLENRLQEVCVELAEIRSELAETRSNLAGLRSQRDSMLTSWSWKITAPLRKGYDLVQRLRKD
jgi:hypothetical protein